MNFRGIYNELKRRNVIKVATVYGITAWLIAQVVSMAVDAFGAPPWVMKMVIILLLVGFPLALIFAWAFELTPEGIRKTEDVQHANPKKEETGTTLNWMIIGALVVVLGFVGAERIFFAGTYGVGNNSQLAKASTASIAVLPFDNISSGGAEDAYFSDGLSEELLNTLAGVDSMKVAGRTSSFRFKGDDLDMKQIGEQLGVHHILEGSVRKAGNKVRITVQLVNAKNGDYMWSKTYDRTLDDIFAIQEDISKAVLNELKVRLLPKTQKQLETIPTGDVEAYQTYLKANQVIASRNINDINQAIDLYKQAISLDPGFAQAHAKLAIAYSLQGFYGDVPMEEVQRKIRAQADRALLLNSNLGEAYAAIGLYYENSGDYEEARDAYIKSLELNPNQPYVHGWLGNIYKYLKGDGSSESVRHYNKMYELDPLAPGSIYNYALVNQDEGNYQEAEMAFRKNMRLNPDLKFSHIGLGLMKAGAPFGRLDSAFIYANRAFVQDSSFALSMLFMSHIAARLNISPVMEHYYRKLQQGFPNSQNYIVASLDYSRISGNYSKIDEVVFPYLQQSGLPSTFTPDFIFYPLAAYAVATGRYARVIDAVQAQAPELFNDPPNSVNQSNFIYADVLIGLWQGQGEAEKAHRLTDAYCSGIENMKSTFVGGESGGAYNFYKATCLLHRGQYDKALPLVKEYFLEKNGIYYAPRIFDRPAFAEAMQRPGYQQVYKKVQAELARQRQNVIGYLKKEGDWKPE